MDLIDFVEETMRTIKWLTQVPMLLCLLAAVADASSLKLTLSADKREYLLDEPFFVRVTVRNTGDEDVAIWRELLGPETSGVLFRITKPGEKPRDWQPEYVLDWVQSADAGIYLIPEEEFSRTHDLTRDWTCCPDHVDTLFSVPGKYTIEARGNRYEPSSSLHVTVVEPEGDDAKARAMLLAYPRTTREPLWDHHYRMENGYRRLINEYPHTRYAMYARFYLAQGFWIEPTLWTAKTRRQSTETAGLYRAFIGAARSGMVTALAQRLCARASAIGGNFGDAMECLEQALVNPGASIEDRVEALRWMQITATGGMKKPYAYVPVSSLAKAFGMKVSLEPLKDTLTVTMGDDTLVIPRNKSTYLLNGETHDGGSLWAPGDTVEQIELPMPTIQAFLQAHYHTKDFAGLSTTATDMGYR